MRLMVEQNGRCAYCDCRFDKGRKQSDRYPTLDHVLPSKRGGLTVSQNLVLACRRCNNIKGALTDDEFRPLLQQYGHLCENSFRARCEYEQKKVLGLTISPELLERIQRQDAYNGENEE